MRPKFGLRIEQVRMTGNSGAPDAGDPMQYRALIGWQMEGLRDMKVELGSRVTYDVKHGAFTAQLARPFATSRPAAISRANASSESKPFSPHLFEPGVAGRDPFRQASESSSMVHEIAAAAVSTFKLSRPLPTQQRPGINQRPLSMHDGR